MEAERTLTGAELARHGFIHVTGLPARRDDSEEYKIEAGTNRGAHDRNNGMHVVVTVDGEVWLRATPKDGVSPALEALLKKLCPRGTGAYVPCSNGEAIPSYMVMERVSDPFWE